MLEHRQKQLQLAALKKLTRGAEYIVEKKWKLARVLLSDAIAIILEISIGAEASQSSDEVTGIPCKKSYSGGGFGGGCTRLPVAA